MKSDKKQILAILGFVIILISIPVTMYLVRQTQIFKPRAAFIPKVEFVDATGNSITETTNPNVKLKITKEISQPIPSPSETIDILDYFLTDHPQQALKPPQGHQLSQTTVGNKSYYVKWAPDSFEIHTWDDQFIYLNQDHSNQDFGDGKRAYTFSDGKWFKRQMEIGEKIDMSANKIQWYDGSCNKIGSLQDFPYEITLERYIPDMDLGGDLGKQDVIVIKYDYSQDNPSGDYERFYYNKQWGWVLWELYNKLNDSAPKQQSIFNTISQEKIEPNKQAACLEG